MLRPVLLAALAALALPASAQSSAHDSPERDGVHVVGEWTLTVLNRDGEVIERREFHNDYVGGGFLAVLLAGDTSVGNWSILITAPDGSSPLCADVSGAPAGCVLREPDPDYFATGPQYFDTLTVGVAADSGVTYLRLAGSVTASSAGTIQSVATRVNDCAPSVAPAECGEAEFAGSGPFTFRDLGAEALDVQAGQTVNVQVDVSFE